MMFTSSYRILLIDSVLAAVRRHCPAGRAARARERGPGTVVTRSGGALAAAVLGLFLIPILTFYMLRDWDAILGRISAILPSAQRDTVR